MSEATGERGHGNEQSPGNCCGVGAQWHEQMRSRADLHGHDTPGAGLPCTQLTDGVQQRKPGMPPLSPQIIPDGHSMAASSDASASPHCEEQNTGAVPASTIPAGQTMQFGVDEAPQQPLVTHAPPHVDCPGGQHSYAGGNVLSAIDCCRQVQPRGQSQLPMGAAASASTTRPLLHSMR